MDLARTVRLDGPSTPLLNHLGSRDAALWVLEPFGTEAGCDALASVMRLPWRLVLSESSNPDLLGALERSEDPNDPLVRRRGFIQLVESNPADIQLPPRSLPIYLLNGRTTAPAEGLAALTRRLTMLDALRRSGVRELLVLAGGGAAIPPQLDELWKDGFRALVTVVSDLPEAAAELEAWRNTHPHGDVAAYIPIPATKFCEDIIERYLSSQKDDRVTLRIRDARNHLQRLDITGLDDPEHPLLASYTLLQEGDLQLLQPHDLTLSEVQNFFSDAADSWRPYAAAMPWQPDDQAWQRLRGRMRRLDRDGSDADRIAYIISESGAGGTTLMRMLAWMSASEGYPTLIANAAPFAPKALEVVNFMTRVLDRQRVSTQSLEGERHYEAPWLIVFDRMHWAGREDELRHFLRELERSGRPACVLVVTGPYVPADFYDDRHFVSLANLSHEVPLDAAIALGKHINRYLQPHGPTRTEAEWRNFYDASTVQSERGIAAFWIALSFWVQRQFDMNETIQSWIYRQFKDKIRDVQLRQAVLDIAALSTERFPLPEAMLPPTTDWPVTQKLEDIRREVPGLALARVFRDGDRYWALAHDIIGRFLLAALFYDPKAREQAGFASSLNPEHMRFQVLRRLSRSSALGNTANRLLAEEFAISIFKIDPDHGHANFASFWREALQALDEMPKNLRATSRSFRHHTAISRRRIAKQKEFFPMESDERVALLEQAVTDIRYALENIAPTTDGESDLNLYNSLALAYQDLAQEELGRGASAERVNELRAKAFAATQRAYQSNPDNSFVVETYARSLLADAESMPEVAAENSIEVLALVYAAMDRDKSGQRRFALSKLADSAINFLVGIEFPDDSTHEPANEIEALVLAIRALAVGVHRFEGMGLADFPVANRLRAMELLGHLSLQGNPQVVRLRYNLLCLSEPREFRGQLELLQSLQEGGVSFSPQMRLELALLLHQCDRHHEASRSFRQLRRLWREGEHYVEVPERLRWLWSLDGRTQRQVNAKIIAGNEFRRTAKVRELQDEEVPFRAQEFGQALRPGLAIRGYISFGHNGPFLRPITAVQS